MSDTEQELDEILEGLRVLGISSKEIESTNKMDQQTFQALLNTAIQQAVISTKQEVEKQIADLTQRLKNLEPSSSVEEYKEIEILPNVTCEETLDIVKSVPEFKGDVTRYVSWRQAAFTAHKLFEPYVGSSKYYQAVAILRNKIVGSADAALSAYNTVLNFKAIIERLDFTYMDKKSIFTLEQELSTLRQGQKTIIQFYDEVERKLTAIVNKVIMSNEENSSLIQSLNQKYREQALRVFVSGVKRPLCDTLFSCKPADLPSALALAQELEANQNRNHFAAIYSSGLSKSLQTAPTLQPLRQSAQGTKPSYSGQQPHNSQATQNSNGQQTNSYFQYRSQQAANQSQRYNYGNQNSPPQLSSRNFNQNTTQPTSSFQTPNLQIDSDVSMRTVQPNNFQGPQAQKRGLSSDKRLPQKFQRINHLSEETPYTESQVDFGNYAYDIDPNLSVEQEPQAALNFDTPSFEDEVNFLEEDQLSPTLNEC